MKVTDHPAETWHDWVECLDCGFDFTPDSSPHEDRCWRCAEILDEEQGAAL